MELAFTFVFGFLISKINLTLFTQARHKWNGLDWFISSEDLAHYYLC